MRYDDSDRESRNVEDRRGQGGGSPFGRGGVQIPIPMGGRGGFSLTTMLIIGALMLLFGLNPLEILKGGPGGGGGIQVPMPRMDPGASGPRADRSPFDIPGLPGSRESGGRVTASSDEMKKFVSRVLADTEDVWNRVFQSFGRQYREPKLVLFSGGTQTACGPGMTAMGPFYCPLDQKVYIDLAFYEELKRRFQAPGDFAQAYVVAHEVGHHVQTLLGIASGILDQTAGSRATGPQSMAVQVELQADCLAGVWAYHATETGYLTEVTDEQIIQALDAAAAVGDDQIQRQTQGYVAPESWTHGSSAQRQAALKAGLQRGDLAACESF